MIHLGWRSFNKKNNHMSREIFGPKKFQIEEKIIEKITKREEKRKEARKVPPKAAESELTAEERRALREKMEKETAEFLKPVSKEIRKEEAAKIERWRKYAKSEKAAEKHEPQEKTMETKMAAQAKTAEEKSQLIKRRKGHRRSSEGYTTGGIKPPKHRRMPGAKEGVI
jgi:hypothetical protein